MPQVQKYNDYKSSENDTDKIF